MFTAIPITYIGINEPLSYIYDKLNSYPKYATGVGCFAYRRKRFKKARLIYISLPSGTRKLFEKTRLGFFSNITHYTFAKQFLGA